MKNINIVLLKIITKLWIQNIYKKAERSGEYLESLNIFEVTNNTLKLIYKAFLSQILAEFYFFLSFYHNNYKLLTNFQFV